MKRVMYFSLACADLIDPEVDAIVAAAQKNNKKLGVTGALGFNGRSFCQVLEGKVDVVDALLDTIRKDTRHSSMYVIDEKPIERRAFADWSMLRVDNLEMQHIIDAMKA